MNNDNGLEQFGQAVENLKAALWEVIVPMCEWLLARPLLIAAYVIVCLILAAIDLL